MHIKRRKLSSPAAGWVYCAGLLLLALDIALRRTPVGAALVRGSRKWTTWRRNRRNRRSEAGK